MEILVYVTACLLLASTSTSFSVSPKYFNKLVDETISNYKTILSDSKYDMVELPDINEGFSRKVVIKEIEGHFKAWDGWLVSLSTLRRSDLVEVYSRHGRYFVDIPLTLDTLKLGYNRYEVKFLSLGPSGKISISTTGNEMRVRLAVDILDDSSCKIQVESAEMTKLEGLNADMTGLWPLNWLAELVTEWITHLLKGRLLSNLAREEMQNIVDKFYCDGDFIYHLKN